MVEKQKKPFLYTVRKHKKKCIFFAGLGLWGTNFAVKQFRNYLERRKFCYEGKKFGDEKIAAIGKPRRLILFLNPEANNGKALKSYEKNAAPILHLGGLEITTVKTDYEGQCKALTQYLDPNIDGIIIAGGDGTLSEILTGLLRRKDQESISKIPIGLIPLGRNNRSFARLMGTRTNDDVREIAKAAMNILQQKTKDVSVMEIKSTEGRPTYAVDHIEWGALRDAKENTRLWWTGPLKRRLPYVFKILKNWPPAVSADISFSLLNKNERSSESNQLSSSKVKQPNNTSSELQENISIFAFFVNLLETAAKSSLHTTILPSDIGRLDFVNCGWKLEAAGTLSKHELVKTTEMLEFDLKPLDNEVSWYTIDGEKFEARPIHVKILPNKIRVFCPAT